MRVTVLCVGRLKEKFYQDAVNEYAKRLSAYCRFQVVEVADEKTTEGASEAERELVKRREGERLLDKIREKEFVTALAIDGRKYDSEGFADFLEGLTVAGRSEICFVIGGSLGLHEAVLKRADACVSFSDLTFPHQLMRVILSEQIYRAFKIISHEPYHK